MKNKLSVSIVIAYYNGADYIAETLQSIHRQTVKPNEVVLVNDGSSNFNETQARKAYADCCLTVVTHESNLGLAQARNTAIKASNSDLILPLDQDDLLAETFIEKTIPLLNDPLTDGVYSFVQLFGDRSDLWCPEITLPNLLTGAPPPSSIIFRRELFDKVGGFRSECNSPDSDFWLRALGINCQLKLLPEPLLKYRKHGASLSEKTKLTEISDLFNNNERIYHNNLATVISHLESRLNTTKEEYRQLEEGFKELESGYSELLTRYDTAVSDLASLSIRKWLLGAFKRNRPVRSKPSSENLKPEI
ncbi:MAG: glycosyltransferase family A protein [Candidatus Melainabacteria bacterium]|nr:glycosyltransferase family A protein [Candidatus Melainabacteria bacterium]